MTDPAVHGFELPEALRAFVSISAIDDGGFFIDDLFRRRFGCEAPRIPNHVVAFARTQDSLLPIAYVHFNRLPDMIMVGGFCTDGQALRALAPEQQAAIRAADGIALHTMRYGFARFADTEAHFGYCGDPRAYAVDIQAGFRPTEHTNLIIHTPRPLAPAREAELIARAHALGPF